MDTWERIHQIIAFYQSFPNDNKSIVSYMVTIRTMDLTVYHNFRYHRDNPQVKDEPLDIIDDVENILDDIKPDKIELAVLSTIVNKSDKERFEFYSQFLYPVLGRFNLNWNIEKVLEGDIDLFSLRGLLDTHGNKLVSEAINTVVYV